MTNKSLNSVVTCGAFVALALASGSGCSSSESSPGGIGELGGSATGGTTVTVSGGAVSSGGVSSIGSGGSPSGSAPSTTTGGSVASSATGGVAPLETGGAASGGASPIATGGVFSTGGSKELAGGTAGSSGGDPTGGLPSAGGGTTATPTGGATSFASGGSIASGGTASGGASPATGGMSLVGGDTSYGGSPSSGGDSSAGGETSATGGVTSATGGDTSLITGGTASVGGTTSTSTTAAVCENTTYLPICGTTTGGVAIAKNVACTANDTQLCYKTCGPANKGFKSETCTNGLYTEEPGGPPCHFPNGVGCDYSCYKVPTSNPAQCPSTAPQHNQPCTIDPCIVCGMATGYLDSSGSPKTGFCVCLAATATTAQKWSCATYPAAWPCGTVNNGPGCN